MPRPYELEPAVLLGHLEEMVDATMDGLVSEFLLLPRGSHFLEYADFVAAYEVLRQHTAAFTSFTDETARAAMHDNSRVFGVLRAILGMTAPEWAELARAERDSDVSQGAARSLDRKCRADAAWVARVETRAPVSAARLRDMVAVAVEYIRAGAPAARPGVLHRLDKFDTAHGLASLQYAAEQHVPLAVLLYERYLGRPFASHRDAVSELVGEVMQSSVEDRLRGAGIPVRKTGRAERIPGFGQAPDFCIPDEAAPAVVIEAKITSDDGTARDKVTRLLNLVTQRNRHVSEGRPHYQVVACIDGRGFGQRREDMRQMLRALDGKVFTTGTLDDLIPYTRLSEFLPRDAPAAVD